MGNIIDGKALSAAVKEEVRAQVPQLEARYGRKPCLVVIIVGENPLPTSARKPCSGRSGN